MTASGDPAVFLDRDGTISVEKGYIDDVGKFKLYPDSAEALTILRSAGYKLVVVTNQSGVARGFYPESRVCEINDMMRAMLEEKGVLLDGVYFCPHMENGDVPEYSTACSCRKPGAGMLIKAQHDLRLNLRKSVMIGDKMTDIKCGKNAGVKTILVRTGYGREEESRLADCSPDERPDAIVDTLKDAAVWIRDEVH